MRITEKTDRDCMNTEQRIFQGEDGLLHCSVCGEAIEALLPAGMELFGKKKRARMCACCREAKAQSEKRSKQMEHDRTVSLLRGNCFSDKNMYNWLIIMVRRSRQSGMA